MEDILETILEELDPDGVWETDGYGLDSCLICPHGVTIEQDGYHVITADQFDCEPDYGQVGKKCVSLLRRAGLI